MKRIHVVTLISIALLFSVQLSSPADASQVKEVVQNILSNDDLIEGIKEALQVGTGNAVELVSAVDGFYESPDIKILFPEKLKDTEKLLKKAGFETLVDEFELSMNRAAEQAASGAKDIFWDAIKQMTITDAKEILTGDDDEATRYFQEKTTADLEEIFKPIVETTMSEVGVTNLYQNLENKVKTVFPLGLFTDFDLTQYVTDKTLDGLFLKLAEEEKKIREDPEARVTELLKKVFDKD